MGTASALDREPPNTNGALVFIGNMVGLGASSVGTMVLLYAVVLNIVRANTACSRRPRVIMKRRG